MLPRALSFACTSHEKNCDRKGLQQTQESNRNSKNLGIAAAALQACFLCLPLTLSPSTQAETANISLQETFDRKQSPAASSFGTSELQLSHASTISLYCSRILLACSSLRFLGAMLTEGTVLLGVTADRQATFALNCLSCKVGSFLFGVESVLDVAYLYALPAVAILEVMTGATSREAQAISSTTSSATSKIKDPPSAFKTTSSIHCSLVTPPPGCQCRGPALQPLALRDRCIQAAAA